MVVDSFVRWDCPLWSLGLIRTFKVGTLVVEHTDPESDTPNLRKRHTPQAGCKLFSDFSALEHVMSTSFQGEGHQGAECGDWRLRAWLGVFRTFAV